MIDIFKHLRTLLLRWVDPSCIAQRLTNGQKPEKSEFYQMNNDFWKLQMRFFFFFVTEDILVLLNKNSSGILEEEKGLWK